MPPFKQLREALQYLENGTIDFYGDTIEHTDLREKRFAFTMPLYMVGFLDLGVDLYSARFSKNSKFSRATLVTQLKNRTSQYTK